MATSNDEVMAAFAAQQELSSTMRTLATQPTARGFAGVAFTVGAGEDEDESIGPALLTALANDDIDAEVEDTGVGWGGDTSAVAVILNGIELVGTYGGGVTLIGSALWKSSQLVRRAYARIRSIGHDPDMSLGAATLLCAADLHDKIGEQAFERIALLHCSDLHAERGATLGHSGAGELYFVLFGNRESSWVYLVNSRGRLLHQSAGQPLPWSIYWPIGYDPVGIDAAEGPPPEPPELYDWRDEAE